MKKRFVKGKKKRKGDTIAIESCIKYLHLYITRIDPAFFNDNPNIGRVSIITRWASLMGYTLQGDPIKWMIKIYRSPVWVDILNQMRGKHDGIVTAYQIDVLFDFTEKVKPIAPKEKVKKYNRGKFLLKEPAKKKVKEVKKRVLVPVTESNVKIWKADPKKDFWANYRSYMKSKAWKAKRKRLIKLRGRRCEECHTKTHMLHTHHVTYARFGHEADSDLLILCLPCHSKKHPDKPAFVWDDGKKKGATSNEEYDL